MEATMPDVEVQPEPTTTPRTRRTFGKAVLMWVRRAHLYLGLFLFPWAVLYGVSAFLFNHPTAFSDAPSKDFDKSAISGSPLADVPSLRQQAEDVLKTLNEQQKPETPYTLGTGEIRYSRDFAFATVKNQGHLLNVLIDPRNGSGSIRTTVDQPKPPPPPKAPFAMGNAPNPGRGGGGGRAPRQDESGSTSLKVPNNLYDRMLATMPTLLEKTGQTVGEVTVTSVPEIIFPIEAEGKTWIATYNPKAGTLSGKLPGEPAELGWRRFLLRLHTAHGYPGEVNARWSWAVIVDVMAFVMCFWGISGLFMWWQIKATRKLGAVVLVLSAIAATVLGVMMYTAMVQQ
jgi:hypothetical protein